MPTSKENQSKETNPALNRLSWCSWWTLSQFNCPTRSRLSSNWSNTDKSLSTFPAEMPTSSTTMPMIWSQVSRLNLMNWRIKHSSWRNLLRRTKQKGHVTSSWPSLRRIKISSKDWSRGRLWNRLKKGSTNACKRNFKVETRNTLTTKESFGHCFLKCSTINRKFYNLQIDYRQKTKLITSPCCCFIFNLLWQILPGSLSIEIIVIVFQLRIN